MRGFTIFIEGSLLHLISHFAALTCSGIVEAEVGMRTVVRWLLKPLATPLFFVGFLFLWLGSRLQKSAGATLSFMTGALLIVLAMVADGGRSLGRRQLARPMAREIELELEMEKPS